MSSSIANPAAPALGGVRVAFVGAGPGDPGLMTVRGREYLAAADVVVHDPDMAEDVRRWTREDARLVDVGSVQGDTPAARHLALVRAATGLDQQEVLVVRVVSGDPGTFGGLAGEALACRRAGLPIEVVPGVSHAAAVPWYAGVPLTGEGAGELHIVDASQPCADWGRSAAEEVTVVVTGDAEQVAAALTALLAAGRDGGTPVCVTEGGTTVTQHTEVTTLAAAADAVLVAGAGSRRVAVVGRQVELRSELSWYETKPLFGWSVLVPRTKEQAGTMTDRIAAYGATAEVVPTIRVEPPRTPQQMDRAIKGVVTGRYEWIGFTSANAVRAVREKFAELGLDARALAGLKVAAVGGVTAEALRAWGLEPDLLPSGEESARGLLEVWPPYDEVLDPINRVYLPRADIATDTLVAGLQELGWEVDDVTAYRTVRAAPPAAPVREAIKTGAFDAVCFTSSSTVRNLVGIAGKPHPQTLVACIGPATARTAEEHGLRVDVVAPSASATALVDALARHAESLAVAAVRAGEPVLRPSEHRAQRRRPAARTRA